MGHVGVHVQRAGREEHDPAAGGLRGVDGFLNGVLVVLAVVRNRAELRRVEDRALHVGDRVDAAVIAGVREVRQHGLGAGALGFDELVPELRFVRLRECD